MTQTAVKRFRFFRHKPVKAMRRDGDKIVLTFVHPIAGQPGDQVTVTQQDWDNHGEWRPVPDTRLAYIRQHFT